MIISLTEINNFDKMQLRGERGLFGLCFTSPSIIKKCQGTLTLEFEVKLLGRMLLAGLFWLLQSHALLASLYSLGLPAPGMFQPKFLGPTTSISNQDTPYRHDQ